MNKSQILKSAKEVLTIESKAINDLAKTVPQAKRIRVSLIH